jgi:hypothetical protein
MEWGGERIYHFFLCVCKELSDLALRSADIFIQDLGVGERRGGSQREYGIGLINNLRPIHNLRRTGIESLSNLPRNESLCDVDVDEGGGSGVRRIERGGYLAAARRPIEKYPLNMTETHFLD